KREEELGSEVMRQLERRVVLSVMDRKWREHLYEMDYLKEGIGLRAMAQRDPLVEYQREGYQLFQAMNEAIKDEVVGYLFNLEVKKPEEQAAEAAQTIVAAPGADGADTGSAAAGERDSSAKAAAASPASATGGKSQAGKKQGGPQKKQGGSGKQGGQPAASGRRAGKKAIPQQTAPIDDPLGLGQPERATALRYSAPGVD